MTGSSVPDDFGVWSSSVACAVVQFYCTTAVAWPLWGGQLLWVGGELVSVLAIPVPPLGLGKLGRRGAR